MNWLIFKPKSKTTHCVCAKCGVHFTPTSFKGTWVPEVYTQYCAAHVAAAIEDKRRNELVAQYVKSNFDTVYKLAEEDKKKIEEATEKWLRDFGGGIASANLANAKYNYSDATGGALAQGFSTLDLSPGMAAGRNQLGTFVRKKT